MHNKFKLGIVILLVVFGLGVYSWYNQNRKDSAFVKEKDYHLDSATQATFENRIVDNTKKLSETKSDDEKFDLLLLIGFDQYTLGHLETAKQTFSAAIKLKPNDEDGYVGLFQTQLEMQDKAGAQESIQKAISINPASTQIWNRYLGFKKGAMQASNEELNNLYREALDKTNNGVDIITSYAIFLETTGDLQGALDKWKQATVSNPTNKSVYATHIKRLEALIKQK